MTGSSIVTAGAFNARIITPSWLVGEGIVSLDSPGDGVEGELTFPASNPADTKMRFEIAGFRWEVSASRVFIGSDGPDSPADLVARLLDALPHTPIVAVGSNFDFRVERGDGDKLPLGLRLGRQPTPGLAEITESRATLAGVTGGGTACTIAVAARDNEILANANYHRPMQASDRRAVIESAKAAAAEFIADRRTAEETVADLLGGEGAA